MAYRVEDWELLHRELEKSKVESAEYFASLSPPSPSVQRVLDSLREFQGMGQGQPSLENVTQAGNGWTAPFIESDNASWEGGGAE